MTRKSEYPNAVDIREAIPPEIVAARAGVDVGVARSAVDAHLFGCVAVAASGATVVFYSDAGFGPEDSEVRRHLDQHVGSIVHGMALDDDFLAPAVAAHAPSRIAIPRYDPVLESELEELSLNLALVREPSLDRDALRASLGAWWMLVDEFRDRAYLSQERTDVVLRRMWEASERHFEDWLSNHLDFMSPCDLELVKRQWATPAGTRADLLSRVTRSDVGEIRPGDLFVIENKAGEAVPPDVDQLSGYVKEAEAKYGNEDLLVGGVLISLTVGEAADAAAADARFWTYTWGEVGFLDHLWSKASTERPISEFLRTFNDSSPWVRDMDS